MKKCVAYMRFSSSNQNETSIEGQQRCIEKFCLDQQIAILDYYIDRACSATNASGRPQFLQMIKDCKKAKNVDYVVVYSFDRFARNRYDSVLYKGQLRDADIKVISVTENIGNTPEAAIMEAVYEAMAGAYSERLSISTRRGMIETAYKARHNGGTCPLGFDVDHETKKYVINEPEAKIVREIFDRFLSGEGYKKLSFDLNARGIRTKRGSLFVGSTINTILMNPKYAGVYRWNVVECKSPTNKRRDHLQKAAEDIIVVDSGLPAIISQEKFLAVQERLKRSKRSGGHFKAKKFFPFTGLIECTCGSPMHANTRLAGRKRESYSTYRCYARAKDKSACITKEIRSDLLDAFVMECLEKRLLSVSGRKQLEQRIKNFLEDSGKQQKQELSELLVQKDSKKKSIENLAKSLEAGLASPTIIGAVTKLEDELKTLEERISFLRFQQNSLSAEQIAERLNQFRTILENPDKEEFQKYASLFIDKITVSNNEISVKLKMDLGTSVRKKDKVLLLRAVKKSDLSQSYRRNRSFVSGDSAAA